MHRVRAFCTRVALPSARFVIVGADGVVRWSYQAPTPAELPGVELLREGLAAAAAV